MSHRRNSGQANSGRAPTILQGPWAALHRCRDTISTVMSASSHLGRYTEQRRGCTAFQHWGTLLSHSHS